MILEDTAYWNMEYLIEKLLNAPDTVYLVGDGMQQRYNNNCQEAQALFYISDSLRRDLLQLQEYFHDGTRREHAS